MVTVPPSFTVRLAAKGKGLNAPIAFTEAKSFAAVPFDDRKSGSTYFIFGR